MSYHLSLANVAGLLNMKNSEEQHGMNFFLRGEYTNFDLSDKCNIKIKEMLQRTIEETQKEIV